MTEPPIRQAINSTLDTITARAASYRNLVILTSLSMIAIPLSAAIWWNPMLLANLGWLLPIISCWLLLDARRVRRWSDGVIEVCTIGKLDLDVFCTTIRHMKHLPQNTIGGMLERLPSQSTGNAVKADSINAPKYADENLYTAILVISVIGCLITTTGQFFNPWLCAIGLAICLISIKLARWWTNDRHSEHKSVTCV